VLGGYAAFLTAKGAERLCWLRRICLPLRSQRRCDGFAGCAYRGGRRDAVSASPDDLPRRSQRSQRRGDKKITKILQLISCQIN